MQKESRLQRLLGFVEEKGFYIILGLCILAIGVSGYVLFFTGAPTVEPVKIQEPVSGQVQGIPAPSAGDQSKTREPEHAPPAKSPPEKPHEEPSQPQKLPSETEKETAAPAPSAVQVSAPERIRQTIYALPVRESEISQGFSGDELIYDETMGDWRTHNGTDFLCDEGDEVLAVLDGTVEKVFSDAMWGNCVLIDHGAGLKSLSCGLASLDGVKAGAKVSAGQAIGRAGSGIPAESKLPCHVHLEMTEDGLRIDPMSILKR